MECEHERDWELAVMEAFASEPGTTADEIALLLGCRPDDVRQTSFYKRVIIARIARDPSAMGDFGQQYHSA